MHDKDKQDYWSDYGQILFHYGKGYRSTPELQFFMVLDNLSLM